MVDPLGRQTPESAAFHVSHRRSLARGWMLGEGGRKHKIKQTQGVVGLRKNISMFMSLLTFGKLRMQKPIPLVCMCYGEG